MQIRNPCSERRAAHSSLLYESRLAQFISSSIETIRTKNWLKHMNEPEVFRREYENQIDPIGDEASELLALMNQAPKWPSTTWYGERDRVGRLRFGFRRLARISKENGFPVVIMIVPLLLDNGGAYSHRAAHRIVEMEARRAGFDTIDLTDQFHERRNGKPENLRGRHYPPKQGRAYHNGRFVVRRYRRAPEAEP